MKIRICTIDKKGKNALYEPLIEHYKKISRPFATIEIVDLFDSKIAKAQDISATAAKEAYTEMFRRCKSGFTIALDHEAKEPDSYSFSKLLSQRANITFFIGGAYGLENKFVKSCDTSVSFGKITLSHKLIKVVLMEQIYRGLTIINNHPYHK